MFKKFRLLLAKMKCAVKTKTYMSPGPPERIKRAIAIPIKIRN